MEDFLFDDFEAEGTHAETSISFLANLGDFDVNFNMDYTEAIPILPVRGTMIFPCSLLPISIGRESSLSLVKYASEGKNRFIASFTQKDDNVEFPSTKDDLYEYGCISRVLKLLKLPNGSNMALIQGIRRVRLIDIDASGTYLMGHVEDAKEIAEQTDGNSQRALKSALKESALTYLHASQNISGSMTLAGLTETEPIINFIAANINISNKEKANLLSMDNISLRGNELLTLLNRENQYVSLKKKIQSRAHQSLSRQQREYFLRQEMENIQAELGESFDGDSSLNKIRDIAATKDMPEDAGEHLFGIMTKLRRMNPQSSDYNVELAYAETFVSLPWREKTKDNINISTAEKALNKDHYGMEEVKERILEHLAVLKMRGDLKSPIICLYGPPGVGKTSLCKSIANSMKRKYVRVSLGGVHDEAEIRGHRRTYIGAMPGRIIKGIIKAESDNPVFVLDEVDKITQQNVHGDPASALLEVLDPEQNSTFHDNYLDFDYDLSNVMFIATANNISTIPAPLRDRMEMIEVSGYNTEEKMEIAKRHLMPKNLDIVGLSGKKIKMGSNAFEHIIENYTRESGVRTLDKTLNKLLRKIALAYARNGEVSTNLKIADIDSLIGPAPFNRDKYQGNEYAGVVTGLAWTAVGGEILFVETSLSKGKGSKLTLTGNLGDVMKESAVLALEYLKAHCEPIGIKNELFDFWNVHIHVPEGATPKDGPSAGITIATSLASAFTQRKVRPHVAMTGEITLRGKVLPVGGIKEKILAAKRAGITDIIICHENRKDIEKIPEKYVNGVTFHYVENVIEVLNYALLDEKVANAIDLEAAIIAEKKE